MPWKTAYPSLNMNQHYILETRWRKSLREAWVWLCIISSPPFNLILTNLEHRVAQKHSLHSIILLFWPQHIYTVPGQE